MASKSLLLTPPNTGHRVKDKENREIDPSSRVVFAKDDQIHILHPLNLKAPAAPVTPSKSSLKRKASKSILKKSSAFLSLPCPPESPQRDVTPEPSDPLCDLSYLVYPVSRIIQPDNALIDASNNKLKEVIEAYCVLTARLRAALAGKSDIEDESWPLFQPIRKNKHAFAEAVVRDLERAVTDIATVNQEEAEREKKALLPSPRNTPQKKKKKDGLNEEQIKYARDMCTTAHAVMRFLGLAFTTPAIHQIFSDKQQRSMFTAVLAIPLAPELPSLNARKTCALAIGLIQTQRLPVAILAPAADRIAYALTRGIEGELGKEGKKGSATDGLKAIHDLSLHLPTLFVPAFGKAPHILLNSVLNNLLAPTLTLRVQAAHALGGYAYACASLRGNPRHNETIAAVSEVVKEFLMTPSQPTSPQKPSANASPSKSELTSSIYRTLRTTLQATEPQHPAHGPVWGLCVLAALIVLLGDGLKKDAKLTKLVGTMMGLAMRHKKSAVRGLACVVWRSFTWIFIGDDVEEAEQGEEAVKRSQRAKEALWNLIRSVTELETGVCTIAGLLNTALDVNPEEEDNTKTMRRREDYLRKSLGLLDSMANKDTTTCGQAFDVMKTLTGVQPGNRKWYNWRLGLRSAAYTIVNDRSANRPSLLPQGLFSANPGLLTAEWKGMASNVNLVYDEMWKADDIRSLESVDFTLSSTLSADEELGKWKGLWVWEGMLKPWKYMLTNKAMWETYESTMEGQSTSQSQEGKAWKDRMWKDMVGVWGALTGLCVGSFRDAEDLPDDILSSFVSRSADVIIEHVLQNQDLDLTVARKEKNQQAVAKKPLGQVASDEQVTLTSQRLEFAMDLWSSMRDVMPADILKLAGAKLLLALMKNAEDFISFSTSEADIVSVVNHSSVENWVNFCINILGVCGVEEVKSFWGYKDQDGQTLWQWKWTPEERRCVWGFFAKKWVGVVGESEWESAIALLAVPFMSDTTFALTKDDVLVWRALLEHAVAKALDYGLDAPAAITSLTNLVGAANQTPNSASTCIHLAEMLLTYASECDIHLPEGVLELVSETMRAVYPPTVAEKTRFLWVLRAISKIFEDYTGDAFKLVVSGLRDALGVCLQDESSAWSSEELEYDIMPLYQALLVGLHSFPTTLDTLAIAGSAISSPFSGSESVQASAKNVFREFWDGSYSKLAEPTEGWPEDVKLALRVVYERDSAKEEPEATTSTITALELSPEVPIIFRPKTPTTPTRELPPSSPVTPSRTRKPSVAFLSNLPPSSPYSPMVARNPQTPRRTPYPTPAHDSPSKRRRLEGDKENMSPAAKYVFRPIVDRIAMQTPYQKASTLGKRRADDEPAACHPSPCKRGKKRTAEVIDDSEDEREDVVNQLVRIPSLFNDSPSTPVPASPMKRKRTFFEAVELPYMRDILQGRLRPSLSFDSAIQVPKTPVHDRVPKPSKSTSKAHLLSKKCVQVDDVFSAPPSDDNLSSDPFELHPRNKPTPAKLSSDDDPHLGQVTPHHLVSPEPSKGRGGRFRSDCDLPSSDEPSPTKDVMQRKMKRMASFTALDNIVPRLGNVTSWSP